MRRIEDAKIPPKAISIPARELNYLRKRFMSPENEWSESFFRSYIKKPNGLTFVEGSVITSWNFQIAVQFLRDELERKNK